MRRFYVMDVQPDLFGQWLVIREWGRIGSPGHMRIATCRTRMRPGLDSLATAALSSAAATVRPLDAA